jgi:hypothetical protein
MPLKAGKFPIGHIEACDGSSKRKVRARVKSEQEMVMTVDVQSGSAWTPFLELTCHRSS